LTVLQQCVWAVDEFKKWLVTSGLVWSKTLLTLLTTN